MLKNPILGDDKKKEKKRRDKYKQGLVKINGSETSSAHRSHNLLHSHSQVTLKHTYFGRIA